MHNNVTIIVESRNDVEYFKVEYHFYKDAYYSYKGDYLIIEKDNTHYFYNLKNVIKVNFQYPNAKS